MGGKIVGYQGGDLKKPIYATQAKSKPVDLTDFLDYIHHYIAPITSKPTSVSVPGEFNQKTTFTFGESLSNEQRVQLISACASYGAKATVSSSGLGLTIFTNKKTSGKSFHPKSAKASFMLVPPTAIASGAAEMPDGAFPITTPQADGAIVEKLVEGTRFLMRVQAVAGGMKYHLLAPKGATLHHTVKVYNGDTSGFDSYLPGGMNAELIKGSVKLDKPMVLTFDSITRLLSAINPEKKAKSTNLAGEAHTVHYKPFNNGPKNFNGSIKDKMISGADAATLTSSVDAAIAKAVDYDTFFGLMDSQGLYNEYVEFSDTVQPTPVKEAESIEQAGPTPPADPEETFDSIDSWSEGAKASAQAPLFDEEGFLNPLKLEWLSSTPVGTQIEYTTETGVFSAALVEDDFGGAYWEGVDSEDVSSKVLSTVMIKVITVGDKLLKPKPAAAAPLPAEQIEDTTKPPPVPPVPSSTLQGPVITQGPEMVVGKKTMVNLPEHTSYNKQDGQIYFLSPEDGSVLYSKPALSFKPEQNGNIVVENDKDYINLYGAAPAAPAAPATSAAPVTSKIGQLTTGKKTPTPAPALQDVNIAGLANDPKAPKVSSTKKPDGWVDVVNGVPADSWYIPQKHLNDYPNEGWGGLEDMWSKYGFESMKHNQAWLWDTYGSPDKIDYDYVYGPASVSTGLVDDPFIFLDENSMWDPGSMMVLDSYHLEEEVDVPQPPQPPKQPSWNAPTPPPANFLSSKPSVTATDLGSGLTDKQVFESLQFASVTGQPDSGSQYLNAKGVHVVAGDFQMHAPEADINSWTGTAIKPRVFDVPDYLAEHVNPLAVPGSTNATVSTFKINDEAMKKHPMGEFFGVGKSISILSSVAWADLIADQEKTIYDLFKAIQAGDAVLLKEPSYKAGDPLKKMTEEAIKALRPIYPGLSPAFSYAQQQLADKGLADWANSPDYYEILVECDKFAEKLPDSSAEQLAFKEAVKALPIEKKLSMLMDILFLNKASSHKLKYFKELLGLGLVKYLTMTPPKMLPPGDFVSEAKDALDTPVSNLLNQQASEAASAAAKTAPPVPTAAQQAQAAANVNEKLWSGIKHPPGAQIKMTLKSKKGLTKLGADNKGKQIDVELVTGPNGQPLIAITPVVDIAIATTEPISANNSINEPHVSAYTKFKTEGKIEVIPAGKTVFFASASAASCALVGGSVSGKAFFKLDKSLAEIKDKNIQFSYPDSQPVTEEEKLAPELTEEQKLKNKLMGESNYYAETIQKLAPQFGFESALEYYKWLEETYGGEWSPKEIEGPINEAPSGDPNYPFVTLINSGDPDEPVAIFDPASQSLSYYAEDNAKLFEMTIQQLDNSIQFDPEFEASDEGVGIGNDNSIEFPGYDDLGQTLLTKFGLKSETEEPQPLVAPDPEPAEPQPLVAPDPEPSAALDPKPVTPPAPVAPEPAEPSEPSAAKEYSLASPILFAHSSLVNEKIAETELKAALQSAGVDPELKIKTDAIAKLVKAATGLNKTGTVMKPVLADIKHLLSATAALQTAKPAADMAEAYTTVVSSLNLINAHSPDLEELKQNFSSVLEAVDTGDYLKSAYSHQKYPGAMLKTLFDKLFAEVSKVEALHAELYNLAALSVGISEEEKVKQAKLLRVKLVKASTEIAVKLSQLLVNRDKLKKATPAYKSLAAIDKIVKVINHSNTALGQALKLKGLKAKAPVGEPVFDKFGVEYLPGTEIDYKDVTEGVVLGANYGTGATAPENVTITDKKGTPVVLNSSTAAALKLAAAKAIKVETTYDVLPAGIDPTAVDQDGIDFPLPSSANVIEMLQTTTQLGSLADVELIYKDQPNVTVSSTGVMSLGNKMDKITVFDVLVEMCKHKLFKKDQDFVSPSGNPLLQVVDTPSALGDKVLTLRLRHTDLQGDQDENFATFIDMMAALGWKHKQVDKSNNPSSNKTLSFGGSGAYFAFEPANDEYDTQLDVLTKLMFKDKNGFDNTTESAESFVMLYPQAKQYLREACSVQQKVFKLTIPEYTLSYEKTQAKSPQGALIQGTQLGAQHRKMTEAEAHSAKTVKSYATAVTGDSDQIRNAGFVFRRHALKAGDCGFMFETPGGKAFLSTVDDDSHLITMRFQPMGALREQFKAHAAKAGSQYSYKKTQEAISGLPIVGSDMGAPEQLNGNTGDVEPATKKSHHWVSHQTHNSIGREVQTPFGCVHFNRGLYQSGFKSADWDAVEIFFDPEVAEDKTHEQLLAEVGEWFESQGVSGAEAAFKQERTEEDDEKLKAAYARKFTKAGKLVGNHWQASSYKWQRSESVDNETVDSLDTERRAMVSTWDHAAAKKNISKASAYTRPEFIKDIDGQNDLLTESAVTSAINDAYDNVIVEHDELTGLRGVIPDAHIQAALGRYGAKATFTAGVGSVLSVLSMTDQESEVSTLGWCGSLHRQMIGLFCGGQSEGKDHEGLGSSGVNYASYQSNSMTGGSSGIYFDLSYIERSRDFHSGDYWGSQNGKKADGSTLDNPVKSRYHQGGYEALFEGSASRTICAIPMGSQAARDKVLQVLEEKNVKGHKTYVWEALGNHPEVFDKYQEALANQGFIENAAADYPEDGFAYKGFLTTSTGEGAKNQLLMSSILADCRAIEAKERQGQ